MQSGYGKQVIEVQLREQSREQSKVSKEHKESNNPIRICLLSYQANHRKTFDVLAGLKAKGYTDVCICKALPL